MKAELNRVAIDGTYCVCLVVDSSKVGHAIQASKGCASTLASMRIELLLRENITTALCKNLHVSLVSKAAIMPDRRVLGERLGERLISTSHEKDTITTNDLQLVQVAKAV